jgi:hypothetical protein
MENKPTIAEMAAFVKALRSKENPTRADWDALRGLDSATWAAELERRELEEAQALKAALQPEPAAQPTPTPTPTPTPANPAAVDEAMVRGIVRAVKQWVLGEFEKRGQKAPEGTDVPGSLVELRAEMEGSLDGLADGIRELLGKELEKRDLRLRCLEAEVRKLKTGKAWQKGDAA